MRAVLVRKLRQERSQSYTLTNTDHYFGHYGTDGNYS
jgi:hypothetical protein